MLAISNHETEWNYPESTDREAKKLESKPWGIATEKYKLAKESQ